jgi:hypothetical protein
MKHFTQALWTVLLPLVLQPLAAHAEWTKLEDNDRATIYVDMDRLQKNAQFATIWQLTDLKKRSKTGTLSSQILMEFDCKAHKRRTVVFTSHDDNMAEGKTLYKSLKGGEWHPVSKDSIAEKMMHMVCEH